jgi:hypothetical protein
VDRKGNLYVPNKAMRQEAKKKGWSFDGPLIETYQNTSDYEADLGPLLKWGRIQGYIGWHVIEDRTRILWKPYKHQDIAEYLKNELRHLLMDYTRCAIQDQDVYCEVWLEKEGLYRDFVNVCRYYCTPVVVVKGYDSVTYLNKFFETAKKALAQGRTPKVKYFGDLDPEGVAALRQSIVTLEDEMGLEDAGQYFERIAVTPEQVIAYSLPNDPDAGKPTSTRYKKHVQEFGPVFVELDAFDPDALLLILRTSLEHCFDQAALQVQKELEQEDRKRIHKIRQRIVDVFNEELGTAFSIDEDNN